MTLAAQYTSTTTAFRLTATPATGVALPATDPSQYGQRPVGAYLQATTQDIRFTVDGTTPTASVGAILTAGAAPWLYFGALDQMQFIRTTAGSVLNVIYVTDPASQIQAQQILSQLTSAQVDNALGYTPANIAGDTFTGQVTVAATPFTSMPAYIQQYYNINSGAKGIYQGPGTPAVYAGVTGMMSATDPTGLANGMYAVSIGPFSNGIEADGLTESEDGFAAGLVGVAAVVGNVNADTISAVEAIGPYFDNGGTATNVNGVWIQGQSGGTNIRGLKIDDQGAANWAIKTGTGLNDFGDAIQLTEQVAPSAPAANQLRLYAVDVGGKTALMVLFPSGAAQQIKIEA